MGAGMRRAASGATAARSLASPETARRTQQNARRSVHADRAGKQVSRPALTSPLPSSTDNFSTSHNRSFASRIYETLLYVKRRSQGAETTCDNIGIELEVAREKG